MSHNLFLNLHFLRRLQQQFYGGKITKTQKLRLQGKSAKIREMLGLTSRIDSFDKIKFQSRNRVVSTFVLSDADSDFKQHERVSLSPFRTLPIGILGRSTYDYMFAGTRRDRFGNSSMKFERISTILENHPTTNFVYSPIPATGINTIDVIENIKNSNKDQR